MKVIEWRKSQIIQSPRDQLVDPVGATLTLTVFTHTNIETVIVNPANFREAPISLGAD